MSWLRENSEIESANGNFVSTSINLKNKSVTGDGCRNKTIEKTILRTFRARTFSRSLGRRGIRRTINTYSGFSDTPDRVDSENKCLKFLQHIQDNIAGGDQALFNYVLDWMA